MNRTVALTLALLIGCAAGTTATHLVSPPAGATTPAQNWKYRCENDIDRDRLDMLGNTGWEMVGLSTFGGYPSSPNFRYCFKRPS